MFRRRKNTNRLAYSDRKLLADEFAKMLMEQRDTPYGDAIHLAAEAWHVSPMDRNRLVFHILD